MSNPLESRLHPSCNSESSSQDLITPQATHAAHHYPPTLPPALRQAFALASGIHVVDHVHVTPNVLVSYVRQSVTLTTVSVPAAAVTVLTTPVHTVRGGCVVYTIRDVTNVSETVHVVPVTETVTIVAAGSEAVTVLVRASGERRTRRASDMVSIPSASGVGRACSA